MTYVLKSVSPAQAHYTPYGGAKQFLYCHDPQVIVHGPAETGKTVAACWKVHIVASKYPKAQLAIVRKTQKSLYGSVLQTFERVIAGAPVEPYGGRKPERYEYPNGAIVWVGGMDNPDKVLSSERDLIYVNQAEGLLLDDWEKLATRTTGRGAVIPYPQLMGDANPGPAKHWIKERAAAGALTLIQSSHRDNPTLYGPDGQLTVQGQRTMLALQGLTGIRRKRLFEGLWATAEGVVYDIFDPPVHVREREAAEFKAWYLAMDEGYANPAVILLIGEDADGRAHVAREFYETGKLQSDVVATAAAWYSEWQCSAAIVDAAGAGLIAALRDAGLPATGAKGRVNDGIHVVQDMLKVQGDGRPRLTVDPACVNVVNEFESYIWKPERDEPVKDNDHAADALRYYAVTRASRGRSGIWV